MFLIEQTETFAAWLSGLRDNVSKARIAQRISRIAAGNFGDHKAVGDGVEELRLHFGPGFRVYYCRRAGKPDVVVILLCGGDKGSQDSDIQTAKDLAKGLEA